MKKTRLGQGLIAGLDDALGHARGKKMLRASEVKLPPPPRIWKTASVKLLRKNKLGLSQSVFASCLGVSVSTVQAWEQGAKRPSAIASRLLELLKRDPQRVLQMMNE